MNSREELLAKALNNIITANDEFRAQMPEDWEADPLQEACDEARKALRAPAQCARETLERIAIVCTDNMDRDCDHRMALDFVRQIANDALQAAALPSTECSPHTGEPKLTSLGKTLHR